MDANEGVQSFNFEVGQKFKSFKEFESQLKHYQDAKFIQMYGRSSCKIESTKTKQTITNNDLIFSELKYLNIDLFNKIFWIELNLNTHVFMEAEILFPFPKDQDQIRGKHLNFVFTNVVQYQGKHSIIFHIQYCWSIVSISFQYFPNEMSYNLNRMLKNSRLMDGNV